jgi:hypothetical protein
MTLWDLCLLGTGVGDSSSPRVHNSYSIILLHTQVGRVRFEIVAINFERIAGGTVASQLAGQSYKSIRYSHIVSEGMSWSSTGADSNLHRPSQRSHNFLHSHAYTSLYLHFTR